MGFEPTWSDSKVHFFPITHAAPGQTAHQSGATNTIPHLLQEALNQHKEKPEADGEQIFIETLQEPEKYLRSPSSQRAGCVCKMRNILGGGKGEGNLKLKSPPTPK